MCGLAAAHFTIVSIFNTAHRDFFFVSERWHFVCLVFRFVLLVNRELNSIDGSFRTEVIHPSFKANFPCVEMHRRELGICHVLHKDI